MSAKVVHLVWARCKRGEPGILRRICKQEETAKRMQFETELALQDECPDLKVWIESWEIQE